MTIRIKCTTRFDITETGIRNRAFRSNMPFQDKTGRTITTQAEWQLARNQQANWETVNQVISLRTLPERISTPTVDSAAGTWSFEFDVVDPSSISHYNNPVGYLTDDCNGVPMITGLGESVSNVALLSSQGTDTNIWFDVIQQIDHK
jgi:hypothetical protein